MVELQPTVMGHRYNGRIRLLSLAQTTISDGAIYLHIKFQFAILQKMEAGVICIVTY